jgi:hypothetical protein
VLRAGCGAPVATCPSHFEISNTLWPFSKLFPRRALAKIRAVGQQPPVRWLGPGGPAGKQLLGEADNHASLPARPPARMAHREALDRGADIGLSAEDPFFGEGLRV